MLLNGTPGTELKCKCGMRQGDLLPPLLFVLAAAHLLQSLHNKAWHEGYLDLPINQPAFDDNLVIQYADDAILILPPKSSKLLTVKQLFDSNANAIG